MKDPNTPIVLNMTVGALREVVCEAWHDSANVTAERLIALLEKRIASVTATASTDDVWVGAWRTFLQEDGRSIERDTQIAFNAKGEILAATVTRDHKERDASPSDLKDIADSLIDNAVLEDPDEWGFELNQLPPWAADQIFDKRKGWA